MELKLWKLYHKNTNMYLNGYMPCPMHSKYNDIKPSEYCFGKELQLTVPCLNSSLCKTIVSRQSRRKFSGSTISFDILSKMLMLSNGSKIYFDSSEPLGLRVNPSAGGRYPIELNIFALRVDGMDIGTYHFCSEKNTLQKTSEVNYKAQISDLCNKQAMLENVAIVIALCANFERTIEKYGERGYRFVYLDAGHIAQNIYLVAEELGLGCVGIGGYLDLEVKHALRLPRNESPIYLLAIGAVN